MNSGAQFLHHQSINQLYNNNIKIFVYSNEWEIMRASKKIIYLCKMWVNELVILKPFFL